MKKKKKSMPLRYAVTLFLIGIFLGSVFSFGSRYWNKKIEKKDCIEIKTQFLGYKKQSSRGRVKSIAIDCANGERYFIQNVHINTKLVEDVSRIARNDNITLFIHPNSSTILEFSTRFGRIIEFKETIDKLDTEANSFLYLGIFMYFCSLVGLYNIASYIIKRKKLLEKKKI